MKKRIIFIICDNSTGVALYTTKDKSEAFNKIREYIQSGRQAYIQECYS